MAASVHTGWQHVTPGECRECGFSDNWSVDGRGNVLCSCQACAHCGIVDAYGFHNPGCVELIHWECRAQVYTRDLSIPDKDYNGEDAEKDARSWAALTLRYIRRRGFKVELDWCIGGSQWIIKRGGINVGEIWIREW